MLQRRGLVLCDRGAGNLDVQQYKGLLLKASYWRWSDRDLAGNAIDFYVKVLGVRASPKFLREGGSFDEAVKELTTG